MMETATTANAPGLQKAIKLMGGQAALARALNVHRRSIWYWLNTAVPPVRARQIHQIAGGKVSLHALRPDLW